MKQYFYATPRLRQAVALRRADGERNVTLAQKCDGYPSWMSNVVAGSRPVRPDDARILRLLQLTGLRFEEAFHVADPPVALERYSTPETAA